MRKFKILHLLMFKPPYIMKKTVTILSFLLLNFSVFSQKPEKLSSNQIFEKIQKINDEIQDALTMKDYKLNLSTRKFTPPRSHQLPKLNP